MKIIINIFGTEISLKQEISLELTSPTLKDVLMALKNQYKGQLERFIKDDLSPVEGS